MHGARLGFASVAFGGCGSRSPGNHINHSVGAFLEIWKRTVPAGESSVSDLPWEETGPPGKG